MEPSLAFSRLMLSEAYGPLAEILTFLTIFEQGQLRFVSRHFGNAVCVSLSRRPFSPLECIRVGFVANPHRPRRVFRETLFPKTSSPACWSEFLARNSSPHNSRFLVHVSDWRDVGKSGHLILFVPTERCCEMIPHLVWKIGQVVFGRFHSVSNTRVAACVAVDLVEEEEEESRELGLTRSSREVSCKFRGSWLLEEETHRNQLDAKNVFGVATYNFYTGRLQFPPKRDQHQKLSALLINFTAAFGNSAIGPFFGSNDLNPCVWQQYGWELFQGGMPSIGFQLDHEGLVAILLEKEVDAAERLRRIDLLVRRGADPKGLVGDVLEILHKQAREIYFRQEVDQRRESILEVLLGLVRIVFWWDVRLLAERPIKTSLVVRRNMLQYVAGMGGVETEDLLPAVECLLGVPSLDPFEPDPVTKKSAFELRFDQARRFRCDSFPVLDLLVGLGIGFNPELVNVLIQESRFGLVRWLCEQESFEPPVIEPVAFEVLRPLLTSFRGVRMLESLGKRGCLDAFVRGTPNPILFASRFGILRAVKMLLEYDATLGGFSDPQEYEGKTALLLAQEKGHEAVVQLLLRC